jgi:hypothetical protein
VPAQAVNSLNRSERGVGVGFGRGVGVGAGVAVGVAVGVTVGVAVGLATAIRDGVGALDAAGAIDGETAATAGAEACGGGVDLVPKEMPPLASA